MYISLGVHVYISVKDVPKKLISVVCVFENDTTSDLMYQVPNTEDCLHSLGLTLENFKQ